MIFNGLQLIWINACRLECAVQQRVGVDVHRPRGGRDGSIHGFLAADVGNSLRLDGLHLGLDLIALGDHAVHAGALCRCGGGCCGADCGTNSINPRRGRRLAHYGSLGRDHVRRCRLGAQIMSNLGINACGVELATTQRLGKRILRAFVNATLAPICNRIGCRTYCLAATRHQATLHRRLENCVFDLGEVIPSRRVWIERNTIRAELVNAELTCSGQKLSRDFLLEHVGQEAHGCRIGLAVQQLLQGVHISLEAELLPNHLKGCKHGRALCGLHRGLALSSAIAVLLAERLHHHSGKCTWLTSGEPQGKLLNNRGHCALKVARQPLAPIANRLLFRAQLVSVIGRLLCGVLKAVHLGEKLAVPCQCLRCAKTALDNTANHGVVQAIVLAVLVKKRTGFKVEAGLLYRPS